MTSTMIRGPVVPPKRSKQRAAFLREFIKSPGTVAAVAPSSRRLAHRMVEGLDFASARAIVEYGPGMGTFTQAVLDELPADWLQTGKFIAIEFNRRMAALFRKNYPGVLLHHDDAANVIKICGTEGVAPGTVDAVISGLGWPSFSDEVRTRILEATHAVLCPGGEFRTFGYHCGLLMRGAWHFRAEVRRLFREVQVGRVVWGNMPPAFVYRCTK